MGKKNIYKFKAKDSFGKEYKGEVESESFDKAREKIKNNYQYILKIKEKKGIDLDKIKDIVKINLGNNKLKLKDLSVFSRQLSSVISAGVPIIQGLNLLIDKENDEDKFKIKDIRQDIKEGTEFSKALEKTKIYPDFFINMIKVGEKSGGLENILKELSAYYDRENKKKKKIISALTYPLVIVVIAILNLLFLLLFVLPSFAETYIELEIELPIVTASLLALSQFVLSNFILILALIILLAVLFFYILKQKRTIKMKDNLLLKIPLIKNFIIEQSLVKFSNNLRLLYKSGIPLVDSLLIVKDTISNNYIKTEIKNAYNKIKEGKNLFQAFKKNKLFPKTALKMLKIGEKTGDLEMMLEKIRDYYKEESEEKFEKITTLIEPAFILALGGMIGIIVLSLIQPIFNMIHIL